MCLETHRQYLTTILILSLLSTVQGHQYLAVASLRSSTSEKSQESICSSWGKGPFWEASWSHKVMVKRLDCDPRKRIPATTQREAAKSCINFTRELSHCSGKTPHNSPALNNADGHTAEKKTGWLNNLRLCLLMWKKVSYPKSNNLIF